MPLQLRVLVEVGITVGSPGAAQLRRRQCNLLVALLLGGRGLVLGLGHRQACRGAVRDVALGGGGETLFLAGFACAAENAGDDLDAAETVGVVSCLMSVFGREMGECLTCRRWPEWGR
jgi:hypothetical protein